MLFRFQRHQGSDEVETLLTEHLSIFRHLIADEPHKARIALERHLRRSVEPNAGSLSALNAHICCFGTSYVRNGFRP